jgi:hypothetical protein
MDFAIITIGLVVGVYFIIPLTKYSGLIALTFHFAYAGPMITGHDGGMAVVTK